MDFMILSTVLRLCKSLRKHIPLSHADIAFDVLVHSCRLECLLLGSIDHPDIKPTLVSMSERTGMTVSHVTNEELYTGLIQIQRHNEL